MCARRSDIYEGKTLNDTLSHANNGDPQKAKFSPRWIFAAFAGFFLTMFVVLGGMVFVAVKGFPGTVTDHAYEKGLAYNHALDAAARQDALGWRGALDAAPQDNGRLRIGFDLKDRAGKPISGANAALWLTRPLEPGRDRAMPLKEEAAGRYAALAEIPERGQWDVRISALFGGHEYQMVRRVVVP